MSGGNCLGAMTRANIQIRRYEFDHLVNTQTHIQTQRAFDQLYY